MAIRPHDPVVGTPTLSYGSYTPEDACRRLLDLAYRDCITILDATHGQGGFWREPLPPGIRLTTNTPGADAPTDLHLDFRATGLADAAYDLAVFDPPHLADGGKAGIMAGRFDTVKGTAALRAQIEDGAHEVFRLARLGVLVKLTDYSHGGYWLPLSDWVKSVAAQHGAHLYTVLHAYRPSALIDPKWQVQRVPRSNGAIYLAFRLDSAKHRDFAYEYNRQETHEAVQVAEETLAVV